MKHVTITLMLCAICLSPLFGQKSLRFIDLSEYDHKIESFLEQADRENKKVLLYFSGDGCRPCKVMKENVFTEKIVIDTYADIILLNSHLIFKPSPMLNKDFKRINKHHLKLIRKFKTENAYPTFYLIGSNGNVIAKKNKMTKEELIAFAQME